MSGMSQAVTALATHVDVIDGTNTTTQTLTGIATDDTILFCGHFTPGATSTFADVTTHITISDADEVTFDADYSSDNMVVVWTDNNCAAGATAADAATLYQAQSNPCIRFSLLAGSATTATITGITTSDIIIGVLHFSTAADITALGTLTDITITAADTITCGTDCSSDTIIVIWLDVDSGATPVAYSSMALNVSLVDGHATTMAVTGMLATDVVLFAGHITTKADITTIVDYTTGCTPGAGTLAYTATTVDDQIWLWWLRSTV